ncbi:hypothetical protein L3D22_04920 [Lysobacter soli]|uniref:DUF6988 family protein n=1 Tax=Lysobacter soli TaxID=453783 RepID=UPI00209E6240|nr:hypothetical protein [Lysobacter soli]UTA55179.1 hypothetical protein L3D22_04920 [Lysobacter soli]
MPPETAGVTPNVSPGTPDALASALDASGQLTALIGAAWESTPAFTDVRGSAAQGLCAISLHHGQAVLSLLPVLPASAIALVRPQYEALVRAVWAMHSATEAQLQRLVAPLTLESQQAARKLPGVPEMLQKLETSGPRGAAALLGRARERLNDGLNSFVHGGIHPFARHQDGYPIALLVDVMKNANAMAMLTLNVLSALPQQAEAIVLVRALHQQFEDVLPTLEPFPAPIVSA